MKEAIDTAELKLVSPLLDGMSVVECLNSGGGFACYLLKRDETDERFVLKHISVPESETNIEALILTGAVADRAGAREYYRSVAQTQAEEVRSWQKLGGCANLSVFTGFQLDEREEDAIGYDFYLLAPYRTSLHKYMQENAITHLQALNLGIDLCNALIALRQAGYVHQDLKPENIFVNETGTFTIGDLGIVALEDLPFASLPEHYCNCYCAPELSDLTANLNATVDIYSVGMILYHLFNGKHAPFEEVGKTMAEADEMRLQGEPLPGPLYADYEMTEILNKACAFLPAERYQSPADLRQALMVYMQKNEISDAMIVSPLDIGERIEITAENMDADAALPEALLSDAALPDAALPEALLPEEPAAEPAPEAQAADEAASSGEAEADEAPKQPTVADEEETPAEEEISTDSSLEDILADVNTYIEPEAAPPAPEPAEPEQEPEPEIDPEAILPRRKRKAPKDPDKPSKVRWWKVLLVAALLALVGAAGWFVYENWFHVTLSNVEAQSGGDYIAVSYTINIADAPLQVDCKDTYGNSFEGEFNGSTVIFRGLTPGSQYFITFDTDAPRILSGTTSINATTTDAVTVESFTAVRGVNSQTVNLTLVVSGPEPEEWTVDYTTEDGLSASSTFTGRSATISGLALNEIYTFTLRQPEDSGIAGQTSITYEVIPEVVVEGLHISELTQDSATVSWNSVGDEADVWQLTCTGSDYSQELEATECSATFTGITPEQAYTFTLSARGMDSPVNLTLDENSTVISDFTAQASDAGTIAVSWSCESESQPEAWLVEYKLANNPMLTTTVKTSQQETVISQAVPGTEYIVQLLADDSRTLVGSTVVRLSTPAAEDFTAHGFTADAATLQFHPAPEAEVPTAEELGEAATGFTPDQAICLALTAPADFDAAGDGDQTDWLITIVIRDGSGTIVDFFPLSAVWQDMWQEGKYLTVLPRTPSVVGSYEVEVYFNSQYVAKSALEIIPAEG